MTTNQTIILTLVFYKLLLLGIGLWASRRVKNEADFFLGGQGLGPWTAGLSYAASTSSAWVLLGFTGAVYAKGLVALWLLPGVFGGYILTWLVMGKKLNEETAAKGHITIVDFITDGFSPGVKRVTGLVSAAMILFCFVFYISSQFQAAGNAFTSIFGISSTEAIMLGAVIIVVYCLLGGFWAASVTDAIQAMVMMLACIIVPVAIISAAGGLSGVAEKIHHVVPPEYFNWSGEGAWTMGALGLAMGYVATGLGAPGQPQLLNRIMAVKDDRSRKMAAAITISWGAIIFTGLVLLAFAARALSLQDDGEAIFFVAAKNYLPPVLAGIVLAAVLSAVMSTVDSLLLAAASAISHDSGLQFDSPKAALLAGRIAMVVVAVVAVLMTMYLPQKIFDRVLFAWVALGAAFGPTVLLKCLGLKTKEKFVLGAIIAGFVIAVSGYNLGLYFDGNGISDYGFAQIMEKYLSWGAGIAILLAGRQKLTS